MLKSDFLVSLQLFKFLNFLTCALSVRATPSKRLRTLVITKECTAICLQIQELALCNHEFSLLQLALSRDLTFPGGTQAGSFV